MTVGSPFILKIIDFLSAHVYKCVFNYVAKCSHRKLWLQKSYKLMHSNIHICSYNTVKAIK